MNSCEIRTSNLFCISCKKKRKLQVKLTAYQLNSTLGIFMCTTTECLYPLNTKSLHKFVYKINSDGEFQNCDPSEVPSLKDLFALLSANAVSSDTTQSEKLLSSSMGSAAPCDRSVKEEKAASCDISVKEEKENELGYQQENDELITKDETCDDSVSYGAKFGASSKTNIFPIWENKDALCWLDSTLCLLVHSKILKSYFKSETSGACQLKDISIAYDEAVEILNSEKRSTRTTRLKDIPFANLEKVRERTFKFLQPLQGCEKGQEDSPVFAIMLLLKQNKYLHSLFLLHFSLELKCSACGYRKVSQNRKTLVTVPGILQDFSDNKLIYPRPCFQCQKPDQKITLMFLKLPPVLLMHFVEGLPHSNIPLYDLVFSQQGYHVRGFVQYREPERHFITWVRDSTGDQWMCCDDLNPPVQRFKARLPDIPASEIHIVMWEHNKTNFEDNFHLHYSGDEYCNESLSSIESASPPLIILDDSDSEAEASKLGKAHKPLSIVNDLVVHTNDIKACAERTVSAPAEKQLEGIVKDNSLSFSSSCKLLSPHGNKSSISKELDHIEDRSVTSDYGQVAFGDSVMHSSSDGRGKESYPEEQGASIQDSSSMTRKASATQEDVLGDSITAVQKSCDENYLYDNKGNSEGGLISDNVPNQNVRERKSCPSLANKSKVFQLATGNGKQDKDPSCASSTINVSKNVDKSVLNLSAPKFSSVPSNENQKSESSVFMTSSRSEVGGEDVRDKSFLVHCAKDKSCLNTELERGMDYVGSCDIQEKNPENKLNLGECSSALSEKRTRSHAVGKKKACAENQPSEVRQNFKQEIVHGENDMSSDSYDMMLCKSIRECYIVLDRSEVELYSKKQLLKQNTGLSTRPSLLKKNKCVQMTAECIDSSAPVKQKEKGRKRKAACLLKQSSFDAGLHDTNNSVEDGKVQAVQESDCSSSGLMVSASVVPDKKFAKKQKSDELLNSSAVESSAPGHASERSSNLSVPETGTAVFPNKFSVRREQQNLDESSQKVSFEEQQITVLQKDGNDCDSNSFLSPGSLNMKQSDKNVMKEKSRDACEAMQKDIKNENSDSLHDELCATANASSEVLVTELNKNQGLSTQASIWPNSHLVHSISPTELDASNKTVNTCGSSYFNIEDKKSSSSVYLPRDISLKIVSSGEVPKSDISTVSETKRSKVRSLSCDEGCTCELCLVRRFLHSCENSELEPPSMSGNVKVLGKTGQIGDADMDLGSSKTSTSVAEQSLNSTVIIQNKNVTSPDKNHSAQFCAKDSSVLEKIDHKTTCSKVPSRKRAVSRKNQSVVGRKKISKSTTGKLEISKEHKIGVDLHDKDLNATQVSEGNDGNVTVKKSETTMTKLPQMHGSCQHTESDHSEQKSTVSAVRTHKTTVRKDGASVNAFHLLESSVQEHSTQPVGTASLPVEQEKVCESVKQVTEQASKRVTYKRFGRQNKLYIGNAENYSKKDEIQSERSDPCRNSPILRRGKKQRSDDDISVSVTSEKLQCKHVSSKLNAIGERCTSDDSVAPKRKVERKFEPDSIKFVEVLVDSQSSDTESTEEERRCGEMQQAVTGDISNSFTPKKTSSVSGTKEKSSPRCVIKYKSIIAEFEPDIESDVLEFSGSPAKEKHFSLNGISTSHPSQRDVSNISMLSCGPENQGVIALSEPHLPTNAIDIPVFDSVDLLKAHLCAESHNSSEQTVSVKESVASGNGNSVRQQSDVPCSSAENICGLKKMQVVETKGKRGRKKKDGIQVVESEKTMTSSEKQFSLNEISISQPSQHDASNISVLSCGPENQGVIAVSEPHLPTNAVDTSTPVFDSVDLLKARLCAQTVSVKESVASGNENSVRQQSDVPCSAESIFGLKKSQVVETKGKRGRKKKDDIQVVESEKTMTQRSSRQNKRGSRKPQCDTDVLKQAETSEEIGSGLPRQKECTSFADTVKNKKGYLTVVKKMIFKHNGKSAKNNNQPCASQDLPTPSRSPLGNQEVTVDITSEEEEKDVLSPAHKVQDLPTPSRSPSGNQEVTVDITSEAEKDVLSPAQQVQDHSDTTNGILTEKMERKKSKSVRFSIEPNDSIPKSKPGRKRIKSKGTSLSGSKTSVLKSTVCDKVDIRSVAVSQEVGVKKRNVTGMPVTPRKRVKSEIPVSSAQNVDCDRSEDQDVQSVHDDDKTIGKVKPGTVSQEAKSSVSKPLCLVNPFLYFPRDLTLNNSSVSVPRPQVLRMSASNH